MLTALLLSLTAFSQFGQAQQAQLSLGDILIGLRSKKVTLIERNQLLSGAVRERGVTFTLTPEIETELSSGGASSELIEAIRQKSPKPKVTATPLPVPVAAAVTTPIATPVPAPTPDFAFYRRRADENNFKGEFVLAVNDYNKAIELNPQDNLAYLNRARTFSNQKNYDAAIADYNKAVELNPKESMAYFNRGDVYEKKGNIQQAISDYQKASELDDSNETAQNNLKRLLNSQAKTLPPEPKKQETPVAPEPKKQEAPIVTQASTTPKTVELGQLNNIAVKLAVPVYPDIAKKLNAQGKVTVQITLDEEGKVVSAKATNGNSLLRQAAEDAARRSKFKPTLVGNQPVKANGFIVYNFVDAP
jgi:TonB family protein